MATNDEQLEKPTGITNGINTEFITTIPYVSGTLKVWQTGILRCLVDVEDGWAETDPAAGEFELNTAPLAGDTIMCRYEEA